MQHLTVGEGEDDDPDLERLCDHVRSWAPGGLPEAAIVVLPREELEAWLLAANTNVKSVEAIPDPTAELAGRKLIPSSEAGRAEKKAARFSELLKPLLKLVSDQKRIRKLPELERFVGKLRDRARRAREA